MVNLSHLVCSGRSSLSKYVEEGDGSLIAHPDVLINFCEIILTMGLLRFTIMSKIEEDLKCDIL